MKSISFSIRPLPPFRLDYTIWVLKRRMDNAWDRWDGEAYRRILVWEEKPIELTVRQGGSPERPILEATARGPGVGRKLESELIPTLERMLGAKVDLGDFYRLAKKDRKLRALAEKFRGMKPPRYPSVFEALVNAITCQQFTLTAGIRLLGRLVTSCGIPFEGTDGHQRHAFPRPQDLVGVDVEMLRRWGFSTQKARAITDLARGIVDRAIDLESLETLDDETALKRLQDLRGVGRWTAEYALLRGLGRIHIFPGDDVGIRNKLQHWLGIEEKLDFEGTRRILSRWWPYGGLIYFHLLLEGLIK